MKTSVKHFLTLALACFSAAGFAQNVALTGTVVENGNPLDLVGISVAGTTEGTYTGPDGRFELSLAAGKYQVVVSLIGYRQKALSVDLTSGQDLDLMLDLARGIDLETVVVTGSRAAQRTALESPVPVDVLNVQELTTAAPQVQLNALLHTVAPSFTSNTQRIADGTDHIDPATLRGLGPDQVLVLVNGKRRHTSSLVNVNATGGRGSVGTDLNALPASAFQDIEVLRDGAAAQYGSDAVAGILNLQLREDVNDLNVAVSTGAHLTSRVGPFQGEVPPMDGEVVNVAANYGVPLGDRGGLIHATGEFNFRGNTQRMESFEGQIFNGFNAIERLALDDGIRAEELTLSDIQSYAQQIEWFSDSTQAGIAGLTSVDGLADWLLFDATEEELQARGQTREDYNLLFGQSEVTEGKAFFHGRLPVGDPENNAEVYAFGGTSYRQGCSGCFYRLPHLQRTLTSIYPDGHLPLIRSDISDKSLAAGIRSTVGGWDTDFSIVQGSNEFLFTIDQTSNATLGSSSPTVFEAGGHAFEQTTSNFDANRMWEPERVQSLSLALGAEYRFERYRVMPGPPNSYLNYDVNGEEVTATTPDSLQVADVLGRLRPSGTQCFPGYRPENAVDARRSNVGFYADVESDITDRWLATAALRFENYSDFGTTLNYKVATRFKASELVSFRAAHSTGFRAPSLQQKYANRTSTVFFNVDGVVYGRQFGVFTNESRAAQLLGIPELEEETSKHYSAGLTARVPSWNLKFSVDAFRIDVADRVILTGFFEPGDDAELQAIFDEAEAGLASFFANAISTNSQGVELVASQSAELGPDVYMKTDLAASFNQTRWDQDAGISASQLLIDKGLVDVYFDQQSRVLLERGTPNTQVSLGHNLFIGEWQVYIRNTYFGSTVEATNNAIFDEDLNVLEDSPIDPVNDPKVLTDLTLTRKLGTSARFTVGANNVFDVYPDRLDPALSSDGRFPYARYSPQFGIGGRYVFVRTTFDLK